MKEWLDALTRLYTTAGGFLLAVVVALVVISQLSSAMPWLVVLVVLALVARVVWARTRW